MHFRLEVFRRPSRKPPPLKISTDHTILGSQNVSVTSNRLFLATENIDTRYKHVIVV